MSLNLYDFPHAEHKMVLLETKQHCSFLILEKSWGLSILCSTEGRTSYSFRTMCPWANLAKAYLVRNTYTMKVKSYH